MKKYENVAVTYRELQFMNTIMGSRCMEAWFIDIKTQEQLYFTYNQFERIIPKLKNGKIYGYFSINKRASQPLVSLKFISNLDAIQYFRT